MDERNLLAAMSADQDDEDDEQELSILGGNYGDLEVAAALIHQMDEEDEIQSATTHVLGTTQAVHKSTLASLSNSNPVQLFQSFVNLGLLYYM